MTDTAAAPRPTIAVIGGDGIGPEVVAEGVKVLKAAAGADAFEYVAYDLGAERWQRTGEVLPDSVLAELAGVDAIILGAVGAAPGSTAIPSGLLERGLLLKLRFAFDHYVNLRPSKLYPGVVTPSSKGDFKVNTRPVDGAGWNDHFWHLNTARTATEPMQDRRRYDLRFRITPPGDSDEPEPMTLASRALHHRSLLFTIRVGFIGEQPASIWKFEGASPFARPHAANEYNRVQLDARGTATLTLRDVHGGLFNGFAWSWDA